MNQLLHSLRLMLLTAFILTTIPYYQAKAVAKPCSVFSVMKKISFEDGTASTAKNVKVETTRNNSVIKIYPDMVKRSIHIIAKETTAKVLDLFIFDLRGILVQNYKMKKKDHLKIAGLARGKYIYCLFIGDEETANGDFEIR